jgi:hypothetical protein
VGVVSGALPKYLNADPPGAKPTPRDQWTILQWSSVPYDAAKKGFGFKASPKAMATLRKALAAATDTAPVMLHVTIASSFSDNPARTLVAEIPGAIAPNERIVVAAHVQEPGANDNASGVATLAELAAALKSGIDNGRHALELQERSASRLDGCSSGEDGLVLDRVGGEQAPEHARHPLPFPARGDQHAVLDRNALVDLLKRVLDLEALDPGHVLGEGHPLSGRQDPVHLPVGGADPKEDVEHVLGLPAVKLGVPRILVRQGPGEPLEVTRRLLDSFSQRCREVRGTALETQGLEDGADDLRQD